MRQFDAPKPKKSEAEDNLEAEIAAELDMLDDELADDSEENDDDGGDEAMAEVDDVDEGGEEVDDEDGLADVRKEMTDEQFGELEKSVKPVKLVLQKVCDWLTDKAHDINIYLSASKSRICN